MNVLCTKLRQKFTFLGIFIAHRRFLCSKHRLFSITSWFSQDLRHSILSLYSSQNWLLLYEQKDWVLNEQLSYFPSIEENFSNQKQSLFNHKWNFILIKVFKMFFLLIWDQDLLPFTATWKIFTNTNYFLNGQTLSSVQIWI